MSSQRNVIVSMLHNSYLGSPKKLSILVSVCLLDFRWQFPQHLTTVTCSYVTKKYLFPKNLVKNYFSLFSAKLSPALFKKKQKFLLLAIRCSLLARPCLCPTGCLVLVGRYWWSVSSQVPGGKGKDRDGGEGVRSDGPDDFPRD